MKSAPVKSYIVVDLDGTLCDNQHRAHLAKERKWDEFHKLLSFDEPMSDVLAYVRMAHETGFNVLFCTGRNETYRDRTYLWLSKYEVPFHGLIMRPDGNYYHDHVVKPRLLTRYFGGIKNNALNNVLCVLDDRKSVVDAWREYGLPCWQVREGTY